jgi:hypothetical protein
MLHRKLGNTGIAVSKIALGTMYFGSETSEEDAFAILDTFVEAALEKVSAPQSGGYPYGAFGEGQRGRPLQDGKPAATPPYTVGSKHPTAIPAASAATV